MTEYDKNNVVRFYRERFWEPGMKTAEQLTTDELKYLHGTEMFARWMLLVNYDQCIDSIREVLYSILNNLRR